MSSTGSLIEHIMVVRSPSSIRGVWSPPSQLFAHKYKNELIKVAISVLEIKILHLIQKGTRSWIPACNRIVDFSDFIVHKNHNQKGNMVSSNLCRRFTSTHEYPSNKGYNRLRTSFSIVIHIYLQVFCNLAFEQYQLNTQILSLRNNCTRTENARYRKYQVVIFLYMHE